jgi:hypothetical protein
MESGSRWPNTDMPTWELQDFYRPVWHVVVLTTLFSGVYLILFVSRFVAAAEGPSTNVRHPRWRAAWQLVPIGNLISFYKLCSRLRQIEGGEHYSNLRPGRKVWVLVWFDLAVKALPVAAIVLAGPLLLLALIQMQIIINNYCRTAAR